MVPTSAHSGDGMGSLIAMIIERCQTTLAKRLSYTDELQATVMEVSDHTLRSVIWCLRELMKKICLSSGQSYWWSWNNDRCCSCQWTHAC